MPLQDARWVFLELHVGEITWSWAEVTPCPVINIYSLLATLSNINCGRKDGWPSVADHFFFPVSIQLGTNQTHPWSRGSTEAQSQGLFLSSPWRIIH